ncbi:MAG: hypothetical protein AUJ36_01065 [Parcubacteria group bacterium CG1_02_41_26]|nr:MAG: hypothetical protein AUJ36_01065 [Parcubacteria group bacterium CG1_02_41_26]
MSKLLIDTNFNLANPFFFASPLASFSLNTAVDNFLTAFLNLILCYKKCPIETLFVAELIFIIYFIIYRVVCYNKNMKGL